MRSLARLRAARGCRPRRPLGLGPPGRTRPCRRSTSMAGTAPSPSRCCSGTPDRRLVSSCSTRTTLIWSVGVVHPGGQAIARRAERERHECGGVDTRATELPTAFSLRSASNSTSRTVTDPRSRAVLRRHGRSRGSAARVVAPRPASTQASMTASRSPSSTWSRLCALNPTRWSLMRFSGKLYVADALAAVDRAHLRACAASDASFAAASSSAASERAPQDPHRGLLVLQLALLVLAATRRRPSAGAVMRTAESVVLTLWPPGPDERYTSMRRSFGSIDDIDLLRLGQDEHACGRGVDAALRLGDGHALDRDARRPRTSGVRTAPSPGSGTPLALTAMEMSLYPPRSESTASMTSVAPASALGVAHVHPRQVAGEQGRLLAALTGLDLDDDVLVVHGVARAARRHELPPAVSVRASSGSTSAAKDGSSARRARAPPARSSPAASHSR